MKENNQNGNGPGKSGGYDETYKRHAVELTFREGRTIKSVSEELGVSTWILYRWRKLYGPSPTGTSTLRTRTLEEAEDEVRRLREELLQMRERETILKKSLGILSETPGSGMPKFRR